MGMSTPVTILVIEKHPMMRAAIVSAIADEPDLTIGAIASNGLDTLQIVESLRPEIILFSIGNSGEKDLETMLELHMHSPDTSLLALITNEVPGQDASALEHGADAVITKTAPRAELLQALRVIKTNREHSAENAASTPRRDAG